MFCWCESGIGCSFENINDLKIKFVIPFVSRVSKFEFTLGFKLLGDKWSALCLVSGFVEFRRKLAGVYFELIEQETSKVRKIFASDSLVGNCEEQLPKPTVGRLSADSFSLK